MMARLALCLLAAWALFGSACRSDDVGAQLSDPCTINTDCNAPLVCAFRKCHVACTASRDCDPGQRCVASDRPFHVCQLTAERSCAYNSDCPVGQACGLDLQCRDQCRATSDCVDGQLCSSGTCAERGELDGGALARAGDAALDASVGQGCLYTSQCDAPLICKNRVCLRECLTSGDCSAGLACVSSRCTSPADGLVGAEGGQVSGLGGKVTLTIAPQALRSRTAIVIAPVEGWPAGALGRVFAIEPSGLHFDAVVTLTYHYADDELASFSASALRLGNAVGARWYPLASKVDPVSRTVSAELAHLSVYGLIDPTVAAVDVGAEPPPPTCNDAACSGAASDGCCPSSCNATSDADCAGCGNGQLDPGETCDPLQSCPASCAAVACQKYAVSNAGTCQAVCFPSVLQTACENGDRCCPPGCNSSSDADCAPSCGNGVVEPGELCDGDCPTKCAAVGCQQRLLQGSAAACNAQCVNATVQTACVAGDACCPSTCTAVTDADCVPSCGNGTVENAEVCDGNCPTACPAAGCQLRVLQGSSASCNAACVDGATKTVCANNDGCCPAGCNTLNDNDCRPVCGNAVIDSGETCDPPASCASAESACVSDANTIVTPSGSSSACTFACARKQRTCGPSDTYCPSGVACGPTSDVDCPGCGNMRIEQALGETCDPSSVCTTQMRACVSDASNVRTSSGSAASCTYRCTTVARTCGPADGFCPPACVPTRDADCAGCGNGRVESALGETCDVPPATPDCARVSCDDANACTTDTSTGSVATCNLACAHRAVTACIRGDGCCPAGCTATTDDDCGAVCGNGVREGAETCDVAPATPLCASINCNDSNACTTDSTRGAAASCNLACVNTAITACVAGDGCCPGGGRGACNANNDSDCVAVCGNGVREGKESCEVAPASPVCSAVSCDDRDACTLDRASGSSATCDIACAHAAITACSTALDGCCPAGCTGATDGDCKPVCGNGVVEPPSETCDTGLRASCPASCAPMGCVLPALINGGTCTAACVDQGKRQTACQDADGCCPTGCSDFSDSDCPTTNDACAQARDISAGGDFPFSLLKARQETAAFCSNPGVDVFFQFKLPTTSAIYLDVYDPKGNQVDVALELYAGGCPAATAQPQFCDVASGARVCNDKVLWPRIFNPSAEATSYVVVARATAAPGRYTLRFHRVPLACLGTGLPATALSSTCSQQPLVTPTCGSGAGADHIYYVDKCPASGLSVDTCSRSTLKTDTILQVNEGSIDLVNGRCILAPTGKAVSCSDDDPTCTAASTAASRVVNAGRGERGIFTVAVDTFFNSPCGGYGLTSAVLP